MDVCYHPVWVPMPSHFSKVVFTRDGRVAVDSHMRALGGHCIPDIGDFRAYKGYFRTPPKGHFRAQRSLGGF